MAIRVDTAPPFRSWLPGSLISEFGIGFIENATYNSGFVVRVGASGL
jgi:hypothetical protein